MSEINNVNKFVKFVIGRGGRPTGLRQCFPGRGSMPKKVRDDVKASLGNEYEVMHPDPNHPNYRIVYDAKAGVYQAV